MISIAEWCKASVEKVKGGEVDSVRRVANAHSNKHQSSFNRSSRKRSSSSSRPFSNSVSNMTASSSTM